MIPLGPRAKQIVGPFLKPDMSSFLFSPAESAEERKKLRSARRKTPLNWGNVPGSNVVARPKRTPGDRFDVSTYRRAIERACDLAFPPPPPLAKQDDETFEQWMARLTPEQKQELKQWRREHRWHPHQLRHTAGTRFRKEYGIEAAQVLLGHKTLSVTEIYAEKNVEAAMNVARAAG